ncbi:MAG TPA: VCBS repeat-containing protein [Ktedonobacteraceae bacterium]|nr:VCBS repeat-containing protein [Ktedonobacteraceae bacterium]
MSNQPVPIRRASLPPAARAFPQRTSSSAMTRNTSEDRSITGIPRSALRHRPVGHLYVIPLTDGTEMHVTERELDDLPAEYQYAAHLLAPPQVPTQRQRRHPNPKRPTPSDTVYEMPPARTDPESYLPERRRLPRLHWFVWVGGALFLMLIGWMALSALGNWWQNTRDTWQYGMPRTEQVDANVGHGTKSHPQSHFIAENLQGQIIVIEFPGDDPTRAKVYIGPSLIGPGDDLAPATLTFPDVNHDGRPDLVIHVNNSQFIFLNQPNGTFKAVPHP